MPTDGITGIRDRRIIEISAKENGNICMPFQELDQRPDLMGTYDILLSQFHQQPLRLFTGNFRFLVAMNHAIEIVTVFRRESCRCQMAIDNHKWFPLYIERISYTHKIFIIVTYRLMADNGIFAQQCHSTTGSFKIVGFDIGKRT